jgi:hypothetical protein
MSTFPQFHPVEGGLGNFIYHVEYGEPAFAACWGKLCRICIVSPYPDPTNKTADHPRDRSQDRGRLPIFHVTLLGKLRLLYDGSYVCVHEQLSVGHLLDHLQGEITLGAYLLDQESRARFVVLDADDAQSWEQLGHLAREDVTAYLEESRRGGHLWLFLAQAVDGQEARAFGHGLLAAHQVEGVELYPKQDQLAVRFLYRG